MEASQVLSKPEEVSNAPSKLDKVSQASFQLDNKVLGLQVYIGIKTYKFLNLDKSL